MPYNDTAKQKVIVALFLADADRARVGKLLQQLNKINILLVWTTVCRAPLRILGTSS